MYSLSFGFPVHSGAAGFKVARAFGVTFEIFFSLAETAYGSGLSNTELGAGLFSAVTDNPPSRRCDGTANYSKSYSSSKICALRVARAASISASRRSRSLHSISFLLQLCLLLELM